MKQFFKQLFCDHKYKLTDNFVLENTDVVVMEVYICEKCGKEKIQSAVPRRLIK